MRAENILVKLFHLLVRNMGTEKINKASQSVSRNQKKNHPSTVKTHPVLNQLPDNYVNSLKLCVSLHLIFCVHWSRYLEYIKFLQQYFSVLGLHLVLPFISFHLQKIVSHSQNALHVWFTSCS